MTTIEKAKKQNDIKVQILSILNDAGNCTLNRLLRLSRKKFNLSEEISNKHIDKLIELDVIKKEMEQGGDGWNTSYRFEVLTLNKEYLIRCSLFCEQCGEDMPEEHTCYTCCGDEIDGDVKDVGLCPTCLEHL